MLLLLTLLGADPPPPKDILVRHVDEGLTAGTVADLYVDDEGWLWIATHGGLYRHESPPRRWGGGLNDSVETIQSVQDGVALVTLTYGRIARMTRDRTELVPPPAPDAPPPRGSIRVVVDGSGTLWSTFEGRLYRQTATGWDEIPIPLRDGDTLRRAFWLGDHGMWVTSWGALLSLAPDGSVRKSYDLDKPYRVLADPDGTLWVTLSDGPLVRIRDDHIETLFDPVPGRVYGVARRGADLWISFEAGLRRWRDRDDVRTFGADQGLPVGGPVVVDHEGSLWMGGFLGLSQLPAPDSVIWTEHAGLPDRHPRTVALAPDGSRYVVTWQGPARIAPDGRVDKLAVRNTEGTVCADGEGGLWTAGIRAWGDPIWHIIRMGEEPRWGPDVAGYWDCATDPAGGVWIAAASGIYHLDPSGTLGRALSDRPATRMLAAGDAVWVATDGGICRSPAADLRAGHPAWQCAPIGDGVWVADILDVDGEVWATTGGEGVFRWDGKAWASIAASRDEPTHQMLWMTRSPRGGVWVAGHGTAVRARPDGAGGWRVLERLDMADGLPLDVTHEITEAADGTLNVSTPGGLVEIASSARGPRPPLPPPEAVSMRLDGEELAPDASIQAVGSDHLLEVDYAVPSYRDPATLRWRVRTSADRPWSEPTTNPRFRWIGLPYGATHIEVQVGRDGQDWVAAKPGPSVLILRPWYQRWWAVGIWAALAAAVLYAMHRVRLSILLRVEQERTRIAMDLHDEIGSGLGSISLLAELAAEGDIPDADRRGIAADAARIAQDLGTALGDIVWSLRRDGGSPQSLATHLLDRGGRMFDPDRTELVLDAPLVWPDVELSLPVRRQVRHMALEAMNNAARHADARQVTVRIVPGRRWTLIVEDDGRGMGRASRRPGSGLGVEGMRLRAERIGATVRWDDRPGGGTVVSIVFDPQGRGGWPWRRGWW